MKIPGINLNLAKMPAAAWIIISVGLLFVLTAISLKILISDNIAIGSDGMSLQDLSTADGETLTRPDVIEGVETELAKAKDPEVIEQLTEIRSKQHQQIQQQQQQGVQQQQQQAAPHWAPTKGHR